MAIYCKPMVNLDGTPMTYEQRAAARRAADAQRQKQQPAPRPDFLDLPEDERRAIRRAEQRGREEARQLAAIEEASRKQAEFDATPEHLRRPENLCRKTIELLRPHRYRPDVARRIAELEREAEERDREIEYEMVEKLRRYEVENNPQTKPAREHWQGASADAETPQEKVEWSRLRGLIEGGAVNRYWTEVQPIMERRLQKLEARIAEHAARQAPMIQEATALAEKRKTTEALQVKPEEAKEAADLNPSPAEASDKPSE